MSCDNVSDINAEISTLQNKTPLQDSDKNRILELVQCLQTKVNNNPSTDVSISTELLAVRQIEIKEAKQDLQIAKERVSTLRDPQLKHSYYESWFPINRPLRSTTIIVCISIGIFFSILTFFMLLKTLGFDLHLHLTFLNPDKLKIIFNPYVIGGGILVGVLIVVGYIRKV